MKPVYERCLNPACKRFEECRTPSCCIADAEKDIWNEAIEEAEKIACDWARSHAGVNLDKRASGLSIADFIRALKRQ